MDNYIEKCWGVKSRKEGTMIYYYVDPDDSSIQKMIDLCTSIQKVMKTVSDKSVED